MGVRSSESEISLNRLLAATRAKAPAKAASNFQRWGGGGSKVVGKALIGTPPESDLRPSGWAWDSIVLQQGGNAQIAGIAAFPTAMS